MKPSERVRLITGIAEALSERDWAYTDLVFQQFGAPTMASYSGALTQYIYECLAEVTPELLVELGQHVGVVLDDAPVVRSDGDMWRDGYFRLFISHLASEKERATKLSHGLDEFRISCFVAHEDIRPSLEWQREIEAALQTMDAMVALVTPGFSESDWTDQEVGYALGRRLLVLPIRLGRDPYGFFGRHQGIQGLGKSVEQVTAAVFDALGTSPLTQNRIADATIEIFAASGSFRRAEANAERLLRFEHLTPAQLRRIEDACLDNLEIYESFGCPTVIRQLCEKHGHTAVTLPAGW